MTYKEHIEDIQKELHDLCIELGSYVGTDVAIKNPRVEILATDAIEHLVDAYDILDKLSNVLTANKQKEF